MAVMGGSAAKNQLMLLESFAALLCRLVVPTRKLTTPPSFGDGFYKLIGKVTVLVSSEPIIVTELATDFCNSLSNGFLLLREFKIHAVLLTLDQRIISLNDLL